MAEEEEDKEHEEHVVVVLVVVLALFNRVVMRIPTARMRGGSVVRSHICVCVCQIVFSSVNLLLTTKRKKKGKRSALSSLGFT